VNYEAFRRTWVKAFRESGLHLDEDGTERIDLHTMNRRYRSIVEFSGHEDDGPPFRTGATLTWFWDALQTARTITAEGELLAGLLGPTTTIEADPPWLRVEVRLHAIVLAVEGIPLPSKSVWAKWVREAIGRLKHVEPLVPTPAIQESESGSLRLLSMQEAPHVTLSCGPEGTLAVQRIEVSGWQALDLPRETYDDEKRARERLDRQLREMFARVKSALHAWTEVMDHFG
jgi:hypothetical protein